VIGTEHGIAAGQICLIKHPGEHIEPTDTRLTKICQASAWELVWYAVVGSKNTRG
jgi:hypothetical protein